MWARLLSPIEARSIYHAGQNGNSFDTTAPSSVTITINVSGNNLHLQWSSGTLESTDHLDGGWGNVPGASAPNYVTPLPASGSRYYRVKVQ